MCTCEFPVCVARAFSCEQYVNMAIQQNMLNGFQALMPSCTVNPNNISAAECNDFNVGLVLIQNNATNLASHARVIYFAPDHWAYRVNGTTATGKPRFASKIGPGENLHIYYHSDNLTYFSFSGIVQQYEFVGNRISFQGTNATFNAGTNTITAQAGATFNPSLIARSEVNYDWSSTSPYVGVSNSTTANPTFTVSPTACPTTATVKVTYWGKGMNKATQGRTQTYTLVIQQNTCLLSGTLYHSGLAQAQPLNTVNFTSAYATNVNICACGSAGFTWTKLSGNGTLFAGTGSSATVYLNSGQSINVRVSRSGQSKDYAFYRSSGWREAGDDLTVEEIPTALVAHPNPVLQKLFVSVPAEQVGEQVHLHDLTGKLVRSMRVTAEEIKMDVGDLAPGIYLLQSGAYTTRVLKGR
ncbi:MAG: hypothetical protein OHK0039_44400 [Bacteroidia bacterium]